MSSVRMILLCCASMMLSMNLAAADREVVLVAASTSPLHNLDSLELRKIYLGFTVKRDGKIIKGLRNTEDENLNSIFLVGKILYAPASVFALKERYPATS